MNRQKSTTSLKHLIVPMIIGVLPIIISVQINENSIENLKNNTQNALDKTAEQITNSMQQYATKSLILSQKINEINMSHDSSEEWQTQISDLNLSINLPEIKYLGVFNYTRESNLIEQLHGYQNTFSSPGSYEEIFMHALQEPLLADKVQAKHLEKIHSYNFKEPLLLPISDERDLSILYFPLEKIGKHYHNNEANSRDIAFLYIDYSSVFNQLMKSHSETGFSVVRSTNHSGFLYMNYRSKHRDHIPMFRYITVLPVMGEHWLMSFHSLPELEANAKNSNSVLIYAAGIILGMLLFIIFYLVSFGKLRAVKLAEKMTQSLKKTEEDFRNAFNGTSTGIVLIGQDMKFGRSNKQFQVITGYSEEEIMGMSFEKIMDLTAEDKKAQQEVVKNQRKTFSNKRILKRKDGKEIWINFNATVVRKVNSKAISYVINIEDITETLKIQREMETSEKCLKMALDVSKSGVWRWDPIKDIAHWDKSIYDIFGIKEKEVKSKSLSILLPMIIPEDRERVAKTFATAINAKKQLICDYRINKQDNKKIIKYIRVVGYPITSEDKNTLEYAGIAIDRTKELMSQEEIIESEKRLSLAMDSFNISVWDWSPMKDLANFDQTAMKMFGMKNASEKGASLKGEQIFKYMHPDDIERIRTGMAEAAKNKSEYEDSFRVILPDKSLRTLHSRISPIPKTKEIKFIGVTTDITEENKLEQLKANFVSVASHQLRTPLTAIRWFREMIIDNQDKEPLTEKQAKHLSKIEESSVRMLELVDDLLQVSKLDNESMDLKPVSYDLLDATNKIIDQVTVKAKEKKQKISVSCRLKKPSVWADRTLTEQVIQNLMTNALKYSPENTTINIKISNSKNYLLWEISDNGIGIPEEDKSKVFQKFFRSKEASESKTDGSGLGLYISKSIIELSGGKIDYKSTHGKGSTFSFTLPKK